MYLCAPRCGARARRLRPRTAGARSQKSPCVAQLAPAASARTRRSPCAAELARPAAGARRPTHIEARPWPQQQQPAGTPKRHRLTPVHDPQRAQSLAPSIPSSSFAASSSPIGPSTTPTGATYISLTTASATVPVAGPAARPRRKGRQPAGAPAWTCRRLLPEWTKNAKRCRLLL